jgi:hypothetical protein
MAAAGKVQDDKAVRCLIDDIGATARSQIESGVWGVPARADWEFVLAEEHLWPPYSSASEDEMLWEEWRPSDEEFMAWAALTLRITAGGADA